MRSLQHQQYTCQFCRKNIPIAQKLAHLGICQPQTAQNHGQQDQVKCPNCQVIYKRNEVPAHRCRIRIDKCNLCGQRISSNGHICQPSQTLLCSQCNQPFLGRQEFNLHLSHCQRQSQPAQSTQQRPMAEYDQCQNCRQFIQAIYMRKHQNICIATKEESKQPSQPQEDTVKCEYCDQSYPLILFQDHLLVCEAKAFVDLSNLEYQQANNSNSPNLNQHNQNRHNQNRSNQNNNNRVLESYREESLLPDGTLRIRISNNGSQGTPDNFSMNFNRNLPRVDNNQFFEMPELLGMNSLNHFPEFSINDFFHPQQQALSRGILLPRGNQAELEQLMRILQNQPQPEDGLEDQELDTLNTVEFKNSKGLQEENKKCVVCMAEYEQNDNLKILPCTHRFHVQCIDQWLKDHAKCPICKKDVRQR